MAAKPRLPPAFERVIQRLPGSRVCMPAHITDIFDQLDWNPFEDVNSADLASENRMNIICKRVLAQHNQRARAADRVHFCAVRDGCPADASYYLGDLPARRVEDLEGRLLGAQNKVFRFDAKQIEAKITLKVRCADLYDGLLMVLGMSGVSGFWIVPWTVIKLRSTSGRRVNQDSAPGTVRAQGRGYLVQAYTPEALEELAPYWTPVAEVPARLLQLLRSRSSPGEIRFWNFLELNTPTNLWQRCELAGNIKIRLVVLLALGWPACYPDEEQAKWDVGFVVPELRKLLRSQEKSMFLHEKKHYVDVKMAFSMARVSSYGPSEKPAPSADVFAFTVNGCLKMLTAKEAFDKGLLSGVRNGEEVAGALRTAGSSLELDTFTSLLSVDSLRRAKAVCEAALEGLLEYEGNRAPDELPTQACMELLESELSVWFGANNVAELRRITAAMRHANFQRDAALEAQYEASMSRALTTSVITMERLSQPFRSFDEKVNPVLKRFPPMCFWREASIPRRAKLSTIAEVYKGSMRGLEGVAEKGDSLWRYEVASPRTPTVRIARGNGFPTEAAAGRAYDRALASLLPVPPILYMLNATRIVVSRGAYVGLMPDFRQKEQILTLAGSAEVDPMTWFGDDPQHSAYVGVIQTPEKSAHLGAWEVKVNESVKGHYSSPAKAADVADKFLRENKSRPNHELLGIGEGEVEATVSLWKEAAAAREALAELQGDDTAAEVASTSGGRENSPLPEGFLLCRKKGEKGVIVQKVLEAQALLGVPDPPPASGSGEDGSSRVDKVWIEGAPPGAEVAAGPNVHEDLEDYRRRFSEIAYGLIDRVYSSQDGESASSLEVWGAFEQLTQLRTIHGNVDKRGHTLEMLAAEVTAKSQEKGIDSAVIFQAAAARAGLLFGHEGFESYESFRRRTQDGVAPGPSSSRS